MLPGAVEDPVTPQKKTAPARTSAQHFLHATPEKVCDAAGDLTERALALMDQSVKLLDEKVPQDSCCSRCLKWIQSFEDPVQIKRCSIARIGFLLVTLVALVCAIYEVFDNDIKLPTSTDGNGSEIEAEEVPFEDLVLDWAEVLSNLYVMSMALFCTVFLGGDLFMFEAFRKMVNKLQVQTNSFQQSNDVLEDKLKNLLKVEQDLAEVSGQLDGNIQAVTELLLDLDKFGKLQTAAVVINQFYACDLDGSGHINGQEADLFVPQLNLLWDLVPDFDADLLANQARAKGLTLAQMVKILDPLVLGDAGACKQVLEEMCRETSNPFDEEGNAQEGKVLAPDPKVERARPMDLEEGSDVEAEQRSALKFACVAQFAAAPGAREVKIKDKDGLTPMFSVPTPACRCGPFAMDPGCSIWGAWHLTAICCMPVTFTFLVLVCVAGETINVVLAGIGLAMNIGLTGTGKMIEVLRALRRQHRCLKVENVRLAAHCAQLSDRVGKLSMLQNGFVQLQRRCAGNVEKAREYIRTSNMKVKASAMAVVTHLFKHADASKSLTLEGDAQEKFLNDLELVFRKVPGFDLALVRTKIGASGTGLKEVKDIIDVIACFGGPEPPSPATPESPDSLLSPAVDETERK